VEIVVDFPGGVRVDTHVNTHLGSYTLKTDQPPPGGEGTAPSPFDMFLAALGACAGFYVLSFCRQRNLPTAGLQLIQRVEMDPITHLAGKVSLTIQLPADFPDKYKAAVTRAAQQCKISQQFEHPPIVEVSTETLVLALA
jgi:ribosomal protein S12 methylthiotransferase accessory factor